jgi:hypothetical protein
VKGASRNLVTLFYAPRRFFAARAEERGGVIQATAFAYVLVATSSSADWGYAQLGWSFDRSLVGKTLGHFLLTQALNLAVVIVTLSGVTHLALYAMGSARRPFLATYRVCAYSAAGSVFSIVPWIGAPILGNIAWVSLFVLGLRETHGLSTRRAIAVSVMAIVRLFVVVLLAAIGAYALWSRR